MFFSSYGPRNLMGYWSRIACYVLSSLLHAALNQLSMASLGLRSGLFTITRTKSRTQYTFTLDRMMCARTWSMQSLLRNRV